MTPPTKQVRLNNSHLLSNWSEPVVLPRNENVTDNCTLLTAPPPMATPTNASISVPFWAYIILGVGGLILLLLLLGTPAMIVLYRNHRQKKLIEEMLKV